MRIKTCVGLWIFLVTASFQFSMAHGDMKHWEFAGWYGGGCYPNVEFDPKIKGRVYLVSDVAGVWRSDDSGENWKFVTNGLSNLIVSLLVPSPSNSDILYAGTNEGLFISNNAGRSWRPCNRNNGEISFVRPHSYRSIAVSASDPSSICVGTAAGSVFCSDNAGQTWRTLGGVKKPLATDKPITAVAYGMNNKTLYAGSDSGLAKYSFDTNEWAVLGKPPMNVADFVIKKGPPETIYVAGQNILFISRDAGQTWARSAPISTGTITRVFVTESNGRPFIAVAWGKDWNGGVLLSRNAGQTWTTADSNMIPDLSNPTRAWASPGSPPTALKISPFNENVIFRTDWWGVWRSDNGGATWNEKIKGAPNVAGSDIFISSQGNIYVATMDDGLTFSPDGGRSYRPLFPVKGYRKEWNGHVWRVLGFGANDNTIIATSSPWGEDVNQVLVSSDGGKTFAVIRNGLASKRPRKNTLWGQGYPRALSADPQNVNRLYLGIDGDDGGGLYISDDAGKTWVYSMGQPGSKKVYNALAVDPIHPTKIFWGACGDGGGVYLSKNGGLSWERVFSEMTWVFDVKIAPNGTVYVAGDSGGPTLYASYDGGKIWKLLKRFSSQGTAEAISIDPKDPNRMAISEVRWEGGSGGKIYWSQDGGKSWEDITGDLPEGPGAAAMAFNPKDGFLYINRYAGSVYKTDVTRSVLGEGRR